MLTIAAFSLSTLPTELCFLLPKPLTINNQAFWILWLHRNIGLRIVEGLGFKVCQRSFRSAMLKKGAMEFDSPMSNLGSWVSWGTHGQKYLARDDAHCPSSRFPS